MSYFIRRWRAELTFAEVRRHLGVETQRQWSDLAIDRSTHSLMALFSIVCLLGNVLHKKKNIEPNHTAWYKKKHLTFSDVLTAVRMEILRNVKLSTSPKNSLFDNYKLKIEYLRYLLTNAAA